QAGDWGEARGRFTVCAAQRSTFVWTWLLRGYAGIQQDLLGEAEDDLAEADRLGPNPEALALLFYYRGLLRACQGRWPAAAAAFREAAARMGDRYEMHLSLATVCLKQEHLDGHTITLWHRPLFQVTVRTKQQQLDEAAGHFARACAAQPPPPPA